MKIRIVAPILLICMVGTLFFLHSNKKVLTERSFKAEVEKQTIEFNDAFNGKFRAKTFYPKWISDTEYAYKDVNDAIKSVNITDHTETELVPSSVWNNLERPSSWELSADRQYVAITFNQLDGYAHYVRTFSVALYEVPSGNQVAVTGLPDRDIQKLKWSTKGHDFAFVSGFNIYLVTNFSADPEKLTEDGDEQLTFNGISDWLYSVEITDDDALLWWSPLGDYLAFATIQQENVHQFEFVVYNNQQYPQKISLPYPKPGTPIPATRLTVVNVATALHMSLAPGIPTSWSGEYYLNSAGWRSDTIFSPVWKNRVENEAVTEDCLAPNFLACGHVKVQQLKSESGWLGHYKVSHVFPLPSNDEYATVGSNNGFPHVQVVNVATDAVDWRTSGEFEVTDTSSGYESIHFCDIADDWIYFTSTELETKPGTGLPRIRHLWRVKAHGDDRTRSCITCGLNTIFPDRCNWVTPSFSTNGVHLVINCGGTGNGVPISTLHRRNSTGDYEFVEVSEDNAGLQTTLAGYYFRDLTYGTINLPGVDGEFYYMLSKPPNFNPNKKYPMLVQVYSGPAYQEVEDRFAFSWKDYVASSLDVVVVSFDGRGTGFRGDDIMHEVYKKLGQYEPRDQIAAAKIIGEQNSFIDATRTAIWGWSYGGYATTRTIEEDAENVFKCGFAVAPVIDWTFYHTIYTERYMLTPDLNAGGYAKSTALQQMENIAKHRYVMLHGTRDENVHFQNAARLNKYLVEGDVDFEAYFAADDDHGMSRVANNYRTVYKQLTRHMCRCFDLPLPGLRDTQ